MKIKPIYKQKVMDKNLSGPELRKLVQELMTKKFKIVKEDDEDDDLGIYNGGFDSHEFDTDAMNAAMADIKASGQDFEPLGKSKFEKNLDPAEFKADLTRANLDLPKEKAANKQIQQNLDKRYKHEKRFGAGSLNETGEWSDDEEGTSWKEELKNELEMVHDMLSPGLLFVIKDIRGFDKYQGPYAEIEINGETYKVWTLEDNQLWVEGFPIDNTSGNGQKPGFAGYPEDVADAFNQKYSILTHMNESIVLEFEEGPQPGDADYHTEKPENTTELHRFEDIDWKTIFKDLYDNYINALTHTSKRGTMYSVNDFTEIGLSKDDIHLLKFYDIINIYDNTPILNSDYISFEEFYKVANEAWTKAFSESSISENENLSQTNNPQFDTSNLYKFLKDALFYAEENGLNYAEAAHLLENSLNENFTISKKINEIDGDSSDEEDMNKMSWGAYSLKKLRQSDNYKKMMASINNDSNKESQIDRPKDAEGQPITNKARVQDLETGAIGHVLHPGIDDNGQQTIHVDWMQNFGGQIPKSITYPNKIVVRDDNRIVREEEIEEGMGQSYTVGKGQNAKPGNYPQTLKRVGLKENLDQAVSSDNEVFLVVDNPFNRAHYKDLIGKTFADAPGYAQVELVNSKDVSNTTTPVAEDYDFSREERAFHNQPEIDATNQEKNEATQYVPESIIKFFIPGTLKNDGENITYKLKIPKQSDETVKDIEQFVKSELLSPNANLYTELEKATNNWIINVNTTK